MNVPELLPRPALYAFARDRERWGGTTAALAPAEEGFLTLARLPGPADGVSVEIAGPYFPGVSGIAAGPCGAIFVADTAHHRVLYLDRRCDARAWLSASGLAGPPPGHFDTPRGLAVSAEELMVADAGNGCVQDLAFPELEVHRVTSTASTAALQAPSAIAVDRDGNIYVVDSVLKRVFRFDAGWQADAAYDATLQAQGVVNDPLFVAVDGQLHLLISNAATATVHVFTKDGSFSHQLPSPDPAWQPGAIGTDGTRVFVHDRASGAIEVFADYQSYCCRLPGWRGPVTALAVDDDGNLLIKTGMDDAFVVFTANAAYASEGTLDLGPFDAGESAEWLRAAADVVLPMQTRARLEVAQLPFASPPPVVSDWIEAQALDTLLAPLVPAVPPATRRWLWLRVTLQSSDRSATPLLRQVRAETPGEDYFDYLPAVFRKTDTGGELARLLALIRSEQSAIDEAIDDLPRVSTPTFARASSLRWLADWLDFDLPLAAPDDERRDLIARAIALHERRGTATSIREIVELHTGIRPAIIEAFTTRGLWILGESSQLGFDTMLPPSHPDGVVIPEHTDVPRALDGSVSCQPVPIGAAVVGESGPLPRDRFGEPMFIDTAHRFDVVIAAHRVNDAALIDSIQRLVEREKPAHTQFGLCVVAPEITVGFQAQIGVDMVVGAARPPLRLGTSRLGEAPLKGGGDGDAAHLGADTRIGMTTHLT